MTIQDDLARPWFQPVVPSEAQQQRPIQGRPTTRIVGELPLDEVAIPARPAPPPMAPAPARVEVTQPYIPAIRDEQPEFAKLLNPQPPTPAAGITRPQSSSAAPAPPVERSKPAVGQSKPAAPVKKRSLMRRVVRRIIGPDLLRKDPPKKQR
jgi:hypothetical protein